MSYIEKIYLKPKNPLSNHMNNFENSKKKKKERTIVPRPFGLEGKIKDLERVTTTVHLYDPKYYYGRINNIYLSG